MLAGDAVTAGRLETLGSLAARGIEILEGGQAGRQEELGELCWQAGGILGQLGLGTGDLDRLLDEGRGCGALGGKLSGAGGGGAFFLLFASRPEAEGGAARLRAAARSLGLSTADSIRPFSWLPSAAWRGAE